MLPRNLLVASAPWAGHLLEMPHVSKLTGASCPWSSWQGSESFPQKKPSSWGWSPRETQVHSLQKQDLKSSDLLQIQPAQRISKGGASSRSGWWTQSCHLPKWLEAVGPPCHWWQLGPPCLDDDWHRRCWLWWCKWLRHWWRWLAIWFGWHRRRHRCWGWWFWHGRQRRQCWFGHWLFWLGHWPFWLGHWWHRFLHKLHSSSFGKETVQGDRWPYTSYSWLHQGTMGCLDWDHSQGRSWSRFLRIQIPASFLELTFNTSLYMLLWSISMSKTALWDLRWPWHGIRMYPVMLLIVHIRNQAIIQKSFCKDPAGFIVFSWIQVYNRSNPWSHEFSKKRHAHQEEEHLLRLAFVQNIGQFQDLGAKISSIEPISDHPSCSWMRQANTLCFLQRMDHLKLEGNFTQSNLAMILSHRNIRCQHMSDSRPRWWWTWRASSSHHLSQS